MNYVYILVEGPHDAAFVARILTLAGCKLVRPKALLDPYWHPLIPADFPVNDDLVARVPIPQFYQNQQHSIAVHAAGSDSKIVATLEESLGELILKNKPLTSLSAIGAIIDADQSPATRFANLRADLLKIPFITKHFPTWPTASGQVTQESPRTGIFVMPDNLTEGTLESLLLDAANTTWPQILQNAKTYVAESKQHLSPTERTQIDKPSGTVKATAACIADLLRPGYAIQNSIKDDNWLTPATLQLPRIKTLQQFLHQLTALP